VFLVVDFGFFTANVTKLLEGGYVPLLLAAAVYGVMWIWHRGTSAVRARVIADEVPSKKFIETIGSHDIARIPGSAVFLTRADSETPPVLVWHVRKNRSLHEYVLILKLVVTSSPRAKPNELPNVLAVRRGSACSAIPTSFGAAGSDQQDGGTDRQH
jgi:KUP system potassium uptake protein